MSELKIGSTFVDGGNTYEVVGKTDVGFSSRLIKIGAEEIGVSKPEPTQEVDAEAEEKAKRAKRTEAATKARLAKLAAKKAKEAGQ